MMSPLSSIGLKLIVILGMGLSAMVPRAPGGTGSAVADTLASSNAWNVDLVNHVGGGFAVWFAQGRYVYASAGPELMALDVSDSAHPVRVDSRV